jgi:hypothetical protein
MTTDKSNRKTSLLDSIKINVVNILVLGGMMALLTSYLEYRIEKDKNQNSFASELNKVKVQRIGESWEDLNIFEEEIDILLDSQTENLKVGNYKKPFDERNTRLIEDLLHKSTTYELVVKLEKNRFWIGEDYYQLMVEFHSLIKRKVLLLGDFNQDSLNTINSLIKNKRLELGLVLEEMKGN